ncbi:MAG: hypothetical protein ACI4TI_02415 [Christensenellales bacterium]
MNSKNTSLESKRFYKTIKKGGNLDFFYENLQDLVFSKLKNNITKTKIENKNSLDIFLTNYISIVLNTLDIDEVDVCFDYNLRKSLNGQIIFGALNDSNQILLPYDIFCSYKNNVFFDMVIIAHELKHFQIARNNEKIIRKIGENSDEKVYAFNQKVLESLGICNKNDLYCFYLFNEHELMANKFSYEFVLELLNNAQISPKNTLQNQLILVFKKNLNQSYSLYLETLKKLKNRYETILLPYVYEKQVELYFESKKLICELYNNPNRQSSIFKLANAFALLLQSFFCNYNEEVLLMFKKFLEEKHKTFPIALEIYKDLLNINNYVVSKNDFENYIKMHKYFNIPFQFEGLNLDRKNVIETYIDLEMNTSRFEPFREKFFEECDLSSIKNSKILKNCILDIKKQKHLKTF